MNLNIYNQVRNVPQEAQKPINAGRLKGKTDINPMWRIKKLTEVFGVCGIGWYTEILDQWLEQGAGGEVSAHVKINLYVKQDGEWSKPIVGVGGSMHISQEKNGMFTDDECYKKAYTDAISVACKALGFGADIYWNSDSTKYSQRQVEAQPQAQTQAQPQAPQKKALTHKMLTPDFLQGLNDWLCNIREKRIKANLIFNISECLDHYYTFEAGVKEVITKYYEDNLMI